MKRLLITLVAALCLLAATTAAASARGVFGVVIDPNLAGLAQSSPASFNSQVALMRRSGVQWMRSDFDWSVAEPQKGVYDWAPTDAVVAAAARHGVQVLPIVEFTPQWASTHPQSAWKFYAPTSDALYAQFVTALVKRYGPHGTFWAVNRHLHYQPIRAWQIWNEPEGTQYDWRTRPWQSSYVKLLKAAYPAIHRADHGATVVSGALVALGCGGCLPWTEATDLYKLGWKRDFDVLAMNVFTLNPKSVPGTVGYDFTIVSRVRAIMARYHDLHKPVWITELTWSAALHRVPKADLEGFETTAKGQAQRIAAFYKQLAVHHPDNIQRAFWYDWASSYSPTPDYPGSIVSFQYTGLTKWGGHAGQPFVPQPGLKAYSQMAHRYRGF